MYVNIFLGYMKCGNNLFLANILAKFVNQHNIHARSVDKNMPPGVWLMGMQHRNIQFYIFFPGRCHPTHETFCPLLRLCLVKTSFCFQRLNYEWAVQRLCVPQHSKCIRVMWCCDVSEPMFVSSIYRYPDISLPAPPHSYQNVFIWISFSSGLQRNCYLVCIRVSGLSSDCILTQNVKH